MKIPKKLISLLGIVLMGILLAACGPKTHDVKFLLTEDDANPVVQEVKEGELAKEIDKPKKEGFAFLYWAEKNQTDKFDFQTKITKNITLIAQWESVNKQTEDAKIDKVLVIGNSFSNDALTYFYEIVEENEIEPNLILGHLDIGGSSLETHRVNALTNNATYNYQKTVAGEKTVLPFHTIKEVLQDEAWDVVSIQQVSGKSGVLNTYNPHLNDLVDYIHTYALNKDVKVAFHMTWAYESTSNHPDFVNYNNNQDYMYENIVYVMENLIAKHEGISYIIPTGTAIQNLRTSQIGDALTTDGYHLNTIGRYAAGVAWIKYFFDVDLEELEFGHDDLTEDVKVMIKEAVSNMAENPFEVTRNLKYMNKLNLLAIGNSFTADSFVYLQDFLNDIGVKEFKIAYLYIGGTSLAKHTNNLRNDSASYDYREYTNSTYKATPSYKASTAFKEEMWDVVIVQQVSGNSGEANTYDPDLNTLISEIKKVNKNPNSEFGFHMTWAYAQNSDHWDFPKYNNSQEQMYQAITNAVNTKVMPNENIDFIIPSGTAIQNARKTKIGDNLTRDGYHLNGLGQYIAGLTWVKAITNYDISKIKFTVPGIGIGNYRKEINQAVEDAYNTPFKVIIQDGSKQKEEDKLDLNVDDMKPVSFEYAIGFWLENATKLSEGGTDPNALHYKYIGTNILSKEELPVGSVLTVESGYNFRIIYFTKSGDEYKVATRSGVKGDAKFVIDADAWGSYEYIGFNFSEAGTPVITNRIDDVASKFKLYQP